MFAVPPLKRRICEHRFIIAFAAKEQQALSVHDAR